MSDHPPCPVGYCSFHLTAQTIGDKTVIACPVHGAKETITIKTHSVEVQEDPPA